MHNIKKYQWGGTPYKDNQQTSNVWDSAQDNIGSILGNNYKNLISAVQPKKLSIDLSGFKTSLPEIKPINSALTEDTARQTRLAGNKNSFLSSVSKYGNLAGDLSASMPNANNNQGTNALNTATDAISDTMMTVNPVIGGAMKVAGFANKGLSAITGGATTINDASNVGDQLLSSDVMALTPVGLVNSLTKKKVAGSSSALAQSAASSAYGASDVSKKTEIGGVSNFFSKLFGGKDLVKSKQKETARINSENAQKATNLRTNAFQDQARTQTIQNTGVNNQSVLNNFDPSKVLLSKRGSKLEKLKELKNKSKNIKSSQHGSALDVIELDKKGGDVNVIPSGALHARINNLEDTNDEMTKKGIPVINIAKKGDVLEFEKDGKTPKVLAVGGEVIQHAEIERDEVILHLSLTNQLEKLKKNNTLESAIEAGKLLSKELMENIEDNTGLIDKVTENEN